MLSILSDEHFMKEALKEAQYAYDQGEVPVGAVVVCQQRIIARGHNATEQLNDVTAHAEIIALTAASEFLQSKYLPDCTMYVTLEPCLMCAGALKWAQFGRLVFAAPDDKNGFMLVGRNVLHPKTQLSFGVHLEESSILLKSFFREKRK